MSTARTLGWCVCSRGGGRFAGRGGWLCPVSPCDAPPPPLPAFRSVRAGEAAASAAARGAGAAVCSNRLHRHWDHHACGWVPSRSRALHTAPRAPSTGSGHTLAQIGRKYQRKTPVEHVLLRPGMYIGAVERQEGEMWVYNAKANKMVVKELSWSAALCKLFDELLVGVW